MKKLILVAAAAASIMSCQKEDLDTLSVENTLNVANLSITKNSRLTGKSSTESIRFEINDEVYTLPHFRSWNDDDGLDNDVNVSQSFEVENYHVNVSILIDVSTNEILTGHVVVRDHALDAEANITLQAGAGTVNSTTVHYNDGRYEIELTR